MFNLADLYCRILVSKSSKFIPPDCTCATVSFVLNAHGCAIIYPFDNNGTA